MHSKEIGTDQQDVWVWVKHSGWNMLCFLYWAMPGIKMVNLVMGGLEQISFSAGIDISFSDEFDRLLAGFMLSFDNVFYE